MPAVCVGLLLSCQQSTDSGSLFDPDASGSGGSSGATASGGSGAADSGGAADSSGAGGAGGSGGSSGSAGADGSGGSGAGGSAGAGGSTGGCSPACSAGQSCNNGVCQCASDERFCDGQCRNVLGDAAHCGDCNRPCSSGVCSNGSCTPVAGGLIGWASVSGRGVTTTTGGQGGSVVEVDTASELRSAAASSSRAIIRISGTISLGELDVSSNKTLVGVGTNATINGGIRIDGRSNVIVQNLRINGKSSAANGDAINIQSSHHVWIDHCDIWDAPDGNLDITNQSDFVTVSWTRFWYSSSPGDDAHRFCNLIGSDDASPDAGYLSVTFHHNWWASRVLERMPRVRYGKVHVFNNYFSSSGNNHCIRAAYEADVRVENNYFENVRNPHEINSDSGTAVISASGNTYSGTSGAQHTRGTAFRPPYDYQLESPSAARAAVQAGWGPR